MRKGVTLPELLVSVAVVGVLMAILLPALGAFRESARKVSCANNIARIARGFESHENSYSRIPGWRNAIEPYASSAKAKRKMAEDATVSWTVPVMPFIGEKEIADWYKNFSATQIADDAKTKRIGLFVCPAVAMDKIGPSPLHYFVNGGTGAMSLENGWQITGDGACGDAAGNLPSQPWYVKSGGRDDYQPCRYSLADIAEGDGTSNTCLLAERTGKESPLDVSWSDSPLPPPNNPNFLSERTTHAILHSRGIHPGYGAPGGGQSSHATANTWMKIRGDNSLRYPSSRHEGGFMMVFCDGHTKFVADSIDEWVYTQILTSDSRPGRLSERVRMFQQMDGTPVAYLFDEKDLN